MKPPAAFQRVMNKIFDGLPFVVVYLDDIPIFSKTEAEHKKHVRQVLSILKAEKLYTKRSAMCVLSEVGEVSWPCDI